MNLVPITSDINQSIYNLFNRYLFIIYYYLTYLLFIRFLVDNNGSELQNQRF